MKTVRLWLLVLLAVLLPVRGAMAAVLLCPPASVGTQSESTQAPHASAAHHGDAHATAAAHPHPHAEHGSAHGHGHGHAHGDALSDASSSASDKCNVCAASCAMTPLAASAPAAFAGLEPAAVVFPAFRVPALSFVSGGQDRPPRSS